MPSLAFRMDPQKDLSTRSDFTFDLMKQVSERLQEAVDAVPEVKAIGSKASVSVNVRQSLRGVDVSVKIAPTTEDDISEDIQKLRQAVRSAIDSKLKETIGQSLQESFKSARARM